MDGDLDIEKEPVPWEGIQDNLLNFDLQECLRFKDTQPEKKEEVISDEPEIVYKREVKNLYETQLELFPSKREFLNKIQEAFCDGLD